MADTAILYNKQNGELYRHIKGNEYKNIRTNAEGEIPEETAKKVLVIDTNATLLLNKYPNIEKLISAVGLFKVV